MTAFSTTMRFSPRDFSISMRHRSMSNGFRGQSACRTGRTRSSGMPGSGHLLRDHEQRPVGPVPYAGRIRRRRALRQLGRRDESIAALAGDGSGRDERRKRTRRSRPSRIACHSSPDALPQLAAAMDFGQSKAEADHHCRQGRMLPIRAPCCGWFMSAISRTSSSLLADGGAGPEPDRAMASVSSGIDAPDWTTRRRHASAKTTVCRLPTADPKVVSRIWTARNFNNGFIARRCGTDSRRSE